ncbi:transposase [Methylorubrum rhodesianum]|uniref:Transposase n=1 Tax=Methylorubrum rhodesianum TaxID=29427 RepID=A0ABU9Z592_9HYPH
MISRGFRYKLDPTPEHDALLRQFAGVCRLVYNLALEQRVTWGRRHRIGYVALAADLTRLRAEFDWVRAVSCQQQALCDLEQPFQSFFAGRAGFPNPRKRGVDDSFRFPGREARRGGSTRSGPPCGCRRSAGSSSATRARSGALRNVTVSLDATGWHVSACGIEHEASAPSGEVVGIDRGVAATLTLSTGERLRLPASLERIEHLKRKAQRVVARRERGSNRRRRAQQRVTHLQARAARIRRDFHHRPPLRRDRGGGP